MATLRRSNVLRTGRVFLDSFLFLLVKPRKNSVFLSLWLFLLVCALALYLAPAAHVQEASAKASMQARGGLQVATFDTLQGRVIVNLPDDMAAGDTISGTVVAEPKGNTDDERAKNLAVLQGYVIEMKQQQPSATGRNFSFTSPLSASGFTLQLPSDPAGTTNLSEMRISLADTGGTLTPGATAICPIQPALPGAERHQAPAPNDFRLPTMGQQGRTMEIHGPFAGNSANTRLMYGPAGSSLQDFEKNTENVTGGFGLISPLAESPRKCVFRAPTGTAGAQQLYLKEGKVETSAPYRNVGVNLTAPKTSLVRGERTTLTIRVEGLQGIKQGVPLKLVKGGVVSMEGGDVQTKTIKPDEVQKDGTYATTRGITGQQAGAFTVTATVVVFDVCLQDESNGNQIQFNSTTGDYIFCLPRSAAAVFPSVVAGDSGRAAIAFYGTSPSDASAVAWTGCTLTLQHNAADHSVFAQMNSCTQTGNATLQSASRKIKFTITDRNMADNTCTCGPGVR